MNQDVSFEQIEATALGFALAEFQGNVSADNFSSTVAISANSMTKAMEWHSVPAKRKRLAVFYSNSINRQDWTTNQNADITLQCLENKNLRVSKGQSFWVIPSIDKREPIYAELIAYDGTVLEFMNPDNNQDHFKIKEIKVN